MTQSVRSSVVHSAGRCSRARAPSCDRTLRPRSRVYYSAARPGARARGRRGRGSVLGRAVRLSETDEPGAVGNGPGWRRPRARPLGPTPLRFVLSLKFGAHPSERETHKTITRVSPATPARTCSPSNAVDPARESFVYPVMFRCVWSVYFGPTGQKFGDITGSRSEHKKKRQGREGRDWVPVAS